MPVYDAEKKNITVEGEHYNHFNGGEILDDIACVLIGFDRGNLSFQDAWLRLKYLQDNMGK